MITIVVDEVQREAVRKEFDSVRDIFAGLKSEDYKKGAESALDFIEGKLAFLLRMK